ncbi:MAG TPA: RloB family protein [Chloroflexota bacterium]
MAGKRRDPLGRRPLKRKVAIHRPRKTLLVFCEGERTEPEYLQALKRQPFVRDVAAVDLHIENRRQGAVPMALVTLAAEARDRAIDEEAEIDEFWCVFDVEWPRNHPKLKEAIDLARRNEIQVAISNPCFELWLILHFREQGGWLNNQQASKIRRQLDGSRGKELNPAKYMPLVKDAAQRAAKMEELHRRNGARFPDDNPSSGMHRLLAAIEP